MLKLYKPKYTTYENEEPIKKGALEWRLLTEEETKAKIITIQKWEDLDIEKNYSMYCIALPYNYYKTKKGKVLCPFDSVFSKYKEWKHKELNFKIVIEYEETEYYSIKDILALKDGKRAIQYLKENGINIEKILDK